MNDRHTNPLGIPSKVHPPVETVEVVEVEGDLHSDTSTVSTVSTGGYARDHAYPKDSILEDYLVVARRVSEAPDSFSLAPVLAVVGRLLTPNVYLDFAGRKYPNLYQFVVGPPGVKKSTSFKLAEALAAKVLPLACIGGNASDSALFDVFVSDPHRLQIESEANPLLKNWGGSHSGREVSNRYLKLYDGDSWTQTYRHQAGEDGEPTKFIDSATLSLALGGTFNGCRFNGIDAQSGLRRRFGYYLAEKTDRTIYWPEGLTDDVLEQLATQFEPVGDCEGTVRLSKAAFQVWKRIQDANRRASEVIVAMDAAAESLRNSLAESPSRILKLAMIFEFCRWAKDRDRNEYEIQADTLELAEAHQAACIEAGKELDTIGRRAELIDDGEKILARVRKDMGEHKKGGWIKVSRSELTLTFARNPGRRNEMTAHRLHNEIMPQLIKAGHARAMKEGQTKFYLFKAE